MKTNQTLLLAATLSAGLLAATGANATLVGSADGKTVWDADLGITWLADANYAKTSGYDVDGKMTWSQAQGWIASLNAENGGIGHLGYNNWRLPTTTDTGTSGCYWGYSGGAGCGYNSTGSEMAHLYFNELGNKSYYSTTGAYQPDYGLVDDPANPNDESLFTNLQSGYYWSGTEYAPGPGNAWVFGFSNGVQSVNGIPLSSYALAVRPGDVAAVPVPAAAWLMGSGLLGLIGVARRRLALR